MPLSLRLPADVEGRLDALAASTGRSKTFYATQAIEEHLADLEDYYAADAISRAIREGREKTIPLAEFMAEDGLES